MWCAVRVNSGDGQALWLTEAGSQGARSVAGDFKDAAIFWRRERAQVAIETFLARDGRTAQCCTIVGLGGDFFKRNP
jgi:hypothetical protein